MFANSVHTAKLFGYDTESKVFSPFISSVTPSITPITSASDGFEAGDYAGLLDENFGKKLSEYMRRTKHCAAGDEFDAEHSSARRKRDGGSFGQAICAAESVVRGTTPGGPWNDLLLVDTGRHMRVADAAGAALEAANVLADFVREYAPLMDVSEDVAQQIGVFILSLAITTIVEDVPLDDNNRIKSGLITTGTSGSTQPSSTSEACPEKTDVCSRVSTT